MLGPQPYQLDKLATCHLSSGFVKISEKSYKAAAELVLGLAKSLHALSWAFQCSEEDYDTFSKAAARSGDVLEL